MFNFFGKKNKLQEPQQPPGLTDKSNLAPASTKVEDDVASFEIPDFTEDDLDFDLGISEFMPEPDANMQPQVSSTDAINNGASSSASSKQDALQSGQYAQQGVANEVPKPENPEQEESEEIPKFNVEPAAAPSDTDKDWTSDKPETKKKAETKKENPLPVLPNHKPYGYESEDFFISEDKYDKAVILVEDTIKKSARAEAIKTDSFELSDSKKQNIEKLTKLVKSITDSLMDTDTRIFEQGDAR
jgi:hypothetical protein